MAFAINTAVATAGNIGKGGLANWFFKLPEEQQAEVLDLLKICQKQPLALYKCLELLDIIHKPLEALGSRFGVTAYTHATEYRNTLNAAHSTVKRLTDGLENEWGNAIPAIRKHQVTGLARIAR